MKIINNKNLLTNIFSNFLPPIPKKTLLDTIVLFVHTKNLYNKSL